MEGILSPQNSCVETKPVFASEPLSNPALPSNPELAPPVSVLVSDVVGVGIPVSVVVVVVSATVGLVVKGGGRKVSGVLVGNGLDRDGSALVVKGGGRAVSGVLVGNGFERPVSVAPAVVKAGSEADGVGSAAEILWGGLKRCA